MSRTFFYPSKYESGKEVMKLAEKLYADSLVYCEICDKEVRCGDTKELEFENKFLDFVCLDCFENAEENAPDEDHNRGER